MKRVETNSDADLLTTLLNSLQFKGLGALRDKQISSAVNVMHHDPGGAWTIAKLAAEVGMSRSPFATKFTAFVGEPPLTYLTHLRMNLAADYLRNGHLRVSEIAERVGYE